MLSLITLHAHLPRSKMDTIVHGREQNTSSGHRTMPSLQIELAQYQLTRKIILSISPGAEVIRSKAC
jgi:hypothetical protein